MFKTCILQKILAVMTILLTISERYYLKNNIRLLKNIMILINNLVLLIDHKIPSHSINHIQKSCAKIMTRKILLFLFRSDFLLRTLSEP